MAETISQNQPGNVETEQTLDDLVLAPAPSLLDESGDVNSSYCQA